MATHEQIFNAQIQKFVDLKNERDRKIEELEESWWLTYKAKVRAKQQIIDAFSEKATELRSNPDYKRAQKLRSTYLRAKGAYETDEENESKSEKQSDYLMICENLKSFAVSMQEEGNNLIHKMLATTWLSKDQINETFYRKWQDILTYFKDFCSWWSNNIYEEKEKNNSVIINQLWLKETFNNIYHRCIILADKYKDSRIKWIEYFDSMVDMFKNIESTIKYSKNEWQHMGWEQEEDLIFHTNEH